MWSTISMAQMAQARTSTGPNTRGLAAPAGALSQAATAEDAAVSIAQAGWLAGCWRMDVDGHQMDEQWMEPAGGAMLGMNRSLRDGEFRGYELLILHQRGDRLIIRLYR